MCHPRSPARHRRQGIGPAAAERANSQRPRLAPGSGQRNPGIHVPLPVYPSTRIKELGRGARRSVRLSVRGSRASEPSHDPLVGRGYGKDLSQPRGRCGLVWRRLDVFKLVVRIDPAHRPCAILALPRDTVARASARRLPSARIRNVRDWRQVPGNAIPEYTSLFRSIRPRESKSLGAALGVRCVFQFEGLALPNRVTTHWSDVDTEKTSRNLAVAVASSGAVSMSSNWSCELTRHTVHVPSSLSRATPSPGHRPGGCRAREFATSEIGARFRATQSRNTRPSSGLSVHENQRAWARRSAFGASFSSRVSRFRTESRPTGRTWIRKRPLATSRSLWPRLAPSRCLQIGRAN